VRAYSASIKRFAGYAVCSIWMYRMHLQTAGATQLVSPSAGSPDSCARRRLGGDEAPSDSRSGGVCGRRPAPSVTRLTSALAADPA